MTDKKPIDIEPMTREQASKKILEIRKKIIDHQNEIRSYYSEIAILRMTAYDDINQLAKITLNRLQEEIKEKETPVKKIYQDISKIFEIFAKAEQVTEDGEKFYGPGGKFFTMFEQYPTGTTVAFLFYQPKVDEHNKSVRIINRVYKAIGSDKSE